MGCNPKCYVDGKGCVISNSGQCAILYDNKLTLRQFQKTFKEMVKTRELSSPSNKSYFYDPTEKKKRKIAP